MDYKKILRGLGISVAGAILTYLAEQLPGVDFGTYTPLVVAGVSTLINAVREYLKTLN